MTLRSRRCVPVEQEVGTEQCLLYDFTSNFPTFSSKCVPYMERSLKIHYNFIQIMFLQILKKLV